MKKCYSYFISVFVVGLLSLGLAGCNESEIPDDPNKENPDNTEASVKMVTSGESEEGLLAPSAEFVFEVEGIESYTYVLKDGDDESEVNGALVYADSDVKDIFAVEADGKLSTTVYGMDGESTYKVVFVFKQKGKETYITKTATVTTDDYKRIINVIKVDPYEVRFHVKVADDVNYRLIFYDYTDYYSIKGQYSLCDGDCFEMFGSSTVYKGSQTISLKDGDPYPVSADFEDFVRIKPAMQFVLIIAECDEKGVITTTNPNPNIYWAGEKQSNEDKPDYVSIRPNVGEYSSKYDEKYAVVDGVFARQVITAVMPKPAAGDVEVTPHITERSCRFVMSPSEEVMKYGFTFLPGDIEATLDAMPEGTDKEIFITNIMKSMEPCIDAEEASLVNLEANTNYSLIIIYQSDEEGFTRGYKAITFQTIKSDKPTIDLVVSQVEAPDQDPYKVIFNIKAPNKDCQVMKYLCNYTAAWESLVYSDSYIGADTEKIMESMISQFGVSLTSASAPDLIIGVNSDEGYNMEFPSWEGRSSTLAIATYNEDEKMKIYTHEARAFDEPAAVRQESPLFESLLGEWSGELTFKKGWEVNSPEIAPATETWDATIFADPGYDSPDVYDSSVEGYSDTYDYYVEFATEKGIANPEEYAKKQLDDLFQEFKDLAAKYKQKYRDQNRVVVYGMGVIPDYKDNQLTPWGLFINKNYHAYNVEQMFREYGPKMFISIDNDDNVQVETDIKTIPQFMGVTALSYHVGAISPSALVSHLNVPLPVDVAEDENVMTVNPLSVDGIDDLYCSIYYEMSGQAFASVLGYSPLVWTRKSEDALSAPSFAPCAAAMDVEVPTHRGNLYNRPFMPTVPFNFKEIKKVTIDMNELNEQRAKNVFNR